MSQDIKRNEYRIDKQSNTAIFTVRDKYGNEVCEFIIDADDVDVVSQHTWMLYAMNECERITGTHCESLTQTICAKYMFTNNKNTLALSRLDKNKFNFKKTNLICVNSVTDSVCGRKPFSKPMRLNKTGFINVSYGNRKYDYYRASMDIAGRGVVVCNVSKKFSVLKYQYAKERAIYAAYLFEKMFYGEDFSEEEYARKEEAFKVLDKAERAEVEDAIVEQLEKLRLARKKINNYYQSQTLAAKLASGEVVVRPDWKVGDVEKSDDVVVEPEPEPEPKPQLEPELAAVDYTIKCSKHLLNSVHQKRNTDEFVHVNHAVLKSGSRWVSVGSLPKRNNIFNVTFTEGNYTDARAMAIYAAYLFEKLVYGDNFPKTEYNRKLEVIKTLSTKEIEFVNERVAGKLEKVYTVLKEMASEKSAKSDEPLSTCKIEKSTDELLKQIKQTPLKEDTLETAATVDEPTEKYPDIFGNPEVQKAIAEMKQKPSLFQRIKNWFAN